MSKVNFIETEAYAKIRNFVLMVDVSVKESKQEDSPHHLDILAVAMKIIEETEKGKSSERFANSAARTIFRRINDVYNDEYLKNSFGNQIRLDYGTGHELNYLCYLYVEYSCGRLKINCVFNTIMKYFEVVRGFVTKFNLESAGGRGVWGLDDYQFLPFLFGSSELFGTNLSLEELTDDKCYIVAVKKKLGGTSYILQSAEKKDWVQVNRGLIKMYDDEVLGRSVVTQHFIYSDYLRAHKAT